MSVFGSTIRTKPLAFYTEKLGFELRQDVTVPEMGNFRWVTVGLPGQDVGLALLTVPGPPVFDAETAAKVKEVLAKGAAGGLFFSTDDVQASYEELKGRGVEFQGSPSSSRTASTSASAIRRATRSAWRSSTTRPAPHPGCRRQGNPCRQLG